MKNKKKILLLIALVVFLPILTQRVNAIEYWNSSDVLTSTAGTASWGGIMINTTNGTINLNNVSMSASCSCNNVTVIRYGDNITMGSTTDLSGTWFTFSTPISLSSNMQYWILCGKTDWNSYNLCYKSPHSTTPQQMADFNLLGYVTASSFSSMQYPRNEAYNINGTGTSIPAVAGTSINLYLNNTQGNVAYDYPDFENFTASINTTGLPITIMKNGTIIASGTTTTVDIRQWGAGIYNITANWSGNSTYAASSTTWIATVNVGAQSISLTGITNNTYPYSVMPICTGNVTSNLYRNYSSADNDTSIQLGAGIYIWTCNTTSNSNYTFATTSTIQNVSRATTNIDMYFNDVKNSDLALTYSPTIIVNVTCVVDIPNSPDNIMIMKRNGTTVGTQGGMITTLMIYPASSVYNYTCEHVLSQNYTYFYSSYFLTINKATPILSLLFNTSDSITQGDIVNINCSDTTTLYLYNDTDILANPFELNTTALSGLFNYTCNTTGDDNYTSNSTSRTLTVNLPFASNATYSYTICYDNNTLLVNQSVYHNGVLNNTVEFTNCPDGCDGTSNACNPPQWEQILIFSGVIIFLCIGGAWLIKWAGKR